MRRLLGLATALVVGLAPLAAAELEVRTGAAALGSFGLDVTLGATCSVPGEVILEAPPATIGGDYEACQTLTAMDVEVAASATLMAGMVVLGHGFTVADGASLSMGNDSLMLGLFAAIATDSPIAEQTFNAGFHLRLDSLSLAEGEQIDHFQALAEDGREIFRVILRRQAGQNLLLLGAHQDGGGEILTPPGQEISLPAGWNQIQLDWRAGAGDGHLMVSVNQATAVGLTALANGLAEVERVGWGAVDGSFAGSPGRLEVDGFTSWR